MLGSTLNSIPDVSILINGNELPSRAYQDLLDIRVQDALKGPSSFTLRLSAWNGERLDFGWADEDLFDIGGEIEIRIGYAGLLHPLMFGDIDRIEVELSPNEVPSVTIQGYDRRHRMLRGNYTGTHQKAKDSDIAAQIARKYGFTPIVEDSGPAQEHVHQKPQSDLEFLTHRAQAIGFELLLEGRILHFRKRKHGETASLTLEATRDLLDFSAKVSTSEQVSEVEVRGWDPLRKEKISGKALSGQQVSMGTRGGPEAARQAFGEATLILTDHAVSTQEKADQLAREQLEQRALTYCTGDGTCIGRPGLRAGISLLLEGVGKRFSGKYYVTSAAHSYAPTRGYRTSFSVRRNAT
jgi:phage protein D